MEKLYKIKSITCPYCGKEYKCLSMQGCCCEEGHHSQGIPGGDKNFHKPCPCTDCLRVIAEHTR